jgi:tRNA(Arg) A34 adenosine deaminase TadA
MRNFICCRRSVLGLAAAAIAALTTRAKAAPAEQHRAFIAAAFNMRDDAVRTGDQAYGAVVVKDGRIIGFGPSRVVLKKDWTAHAEREAIREAQARLGRSDLSGCLLYSSSRPCLACETAAYDAKITRMYFGADAADAGAPKKS